ncbi:acyl carrier protein [Nocardia sp. NPDC051750]|uniref:acyl carrier protein n=1 Tax=Nocardia sp. NPDC051750 TaxID=3364325 RepID=UPI0037B55EDD
MSERQRRAVVSDADMGREVYRVIAAMAPKPDTVCAEQSRLVEDLGFDSLRLMELTVVLERTFGLPGYRPEELAGVLRVGQVVQLIRAGLERENRA